MRFVISFVVWAVSVCLYVLPASSQNKPACQITDPPGPPANCNTLWSTTVELTVGHGAYVHVPDPGCMNDASEQLAREHEAALAMAHPKLALFAGPISKVTGTAVEQFWRNNGEGDLGKLFSPYAKNGALCVALTAIIPVNSQYVGYRLLATDAANGWTYKGCPSDGGECAINWSKFQMAPIVTPSNAMKTVHTIFMNWSDDRNRKVKMIVFYRMPSGDSPGEEL
jgi:hypothetical protein